MGQLLTDLLLLSTKHKTSSSSSEKALVCIAAEVATKLLFSGRVVNNCWLAQLVMIFFAASEEDDNDDDQDDSEQHHDVKQVGNPVRLQQLLSVFFPAYAVKSQQGRVALVESITPLLEMALEESSSQKQKTVIQMIEFVVSTVEAGERAVEEAKSKANNETENDPVEEKTEEPSSSQSSASTTLLVSIQIATFLTKQNDNLGNTLLRALCKYLGGCTTVLLVDDEPPKDMSALKQLTDDLVDMELTDSTSLRSLSALKDLLYSVPIIEDDEEEAHDQEASLVGATSQVAISEHNRDHSPASTVTENSDQSHSPASTVTENDNDDDLLTSAMKQVALSDDDDDNDEYSLATTITEKENDETVDGDEKGRLSTASSRLSLLSQRSANEA